MASKQKTPKPNRRAKATPAQPPASRDERRAPNQQEAAGPLSDTPLAVRLAVLEDVVRRCYQDTRSALTDVKKLRDAQTDLWRRVAAAETRLAATS